VAAFAVTIAPQLARAQDEPAVTETTTTTTTVKTEDTVTVKEVDSTRASDSWGMRGGASLGSGMGAYAEFKAGTASDVNNGFLNVNAGMLFALGRHFDIGFNLRVPMFNLGVSPGLAVRWELVEDKSFHLALVGNLQVPMLFVPGFWLGLSIEPGIMASYFVNDRVELYGGVLFAVTPLFINPWVPGSGHVGFAGTFRAGIAYTLSSSNVGFYANIDVGAGYQPVRRNILLGNTATGIAFNAALTAGVQFKF